MHIVSPLQYGGPGATRPGGSQLSCGCSYGCGYGSVCTGCCCHCDACSTCASWRHCARRQSRSSFCDSTSACACRYNACACSCYTCACSRCQNARRSAHCRSRQTSPSPWKTPHTSTSTSTPRRRAVPVRLNYVMWLGRFWSARHCRHRTKKGAPCLGAPRSIGTIA